MAPSAQAPEHAPRNTLSGQAQAQSFLPDKSDMFLAYATVPGYR